jgi:hypothetical protein
MGQKEVKSQKEISLFCDLNSIYSGIDLKLCNIKENNIFFGIRESYKIVTLANFKCKQQLHRV